MAGITAGMIDVAEVHDAFSVCEPMVLESLGMAPPGRGATLSGELYGTGSRRVNPRGGILGAGHPLGATGLAQAAEVFAQLRGEAGRRQVENAHTGVTQGMSAAGTGSVVVVMES
jgi:acetyl-CoA C-acetyltransferase